MGESISVPTSYERFALLSRGDVECTTLVEQYSLAEGRAEIGWLVRACRRSSSLVDDAKSPSPIRRTLPVRGTLLPLRLP